MLIRSPRRPARRMALLALLAVAASAGPTARAARPTAPRPATPARTVTPARTDSTLLCPLPAGPAVSLDSFGRVLWRGKIVLGAYQALTIGNLFYGPGARVELGVLTGRFRDRVYVRTDRRLLREWKLPAAGLPDSAIAWASLLAARFEQTDTLFVDVNWGGAPRFTTGPRADEMAGLFERWVASGLTSQDRALAARLGVPADRFTAPPEPACPPGAG